MLTILNKKYETKDQIRLMELKSEVFIGLLNEKGSSLKSQWQKNHVEYEKLKVGDAFKFYGKIYEHIEYGVRREKGNSTHEKFDISLLTIPGKGGITGKIGCFKKGLFGFKKLALNNK